MTFGRRVVTRQASGVSYRDERKPSPVAMTAATASVQKVAYIRWPFNAGVLKTRVEVLLSSSYCDFRHQMTER